MSGSGAEPSRLRGEDSLNARAGEGARAMAAELAAGKSKLRRFAERALDVPTEERNWRKGAKGEEVVGRRLDRLTEQGWAVVHDLTIGTRGANLDHLVIGPAGIYTINTKHLSGKVTLYERTLLVNGRKTDYLPKAVREADVVQKALSRSLRRRISVRPLIVLMGCELTIKARPSDVTIVGRRQLPRWFLKLPDGVWDGRAIAETEAAARDPRTWPARPVSKTPIDPVGPGAPSVPMERATPQAPAAVAWSARSPTPAVVPPPPPIPLSSSGTEVTFLPTPVSPQEAAGEAELTVTRWRRFGHDRIYVNTPSGKTLGYLDVPTQVVHVEDPRDRDRVSAALNRPTHPGAST